MTPAFGAPRLEPATVQAQRFRAVIARRLGLRFDEDRLPWLLDLLREHCAGATPADVDAGLDELDAAADLRPWGDLMAELTVGETYFFRHREHFDALYERVLPARWRERPGLPLRLVSAGCASGEEAYSLAMLLASLPTAHRPRARIDALDLNAQAVARALAGRYRAWSLRGMPDEMRLRWLRPEGSHHVLADEIRQAVQFSVRNLLEEGLASFWAPASMDVVFCRNVLMYMGSDEVRRVLERLADCMAPGAFLFLGPAESGLRGLSTDFESCHSHGAFYLRRQAARVSGWAQPAANEAAIPPAGTKIRRTASSRHGISGPAISSPPSVIGQAQRHDIMAMLLQERHADACSACEALRQRHPDALPAWVDSVQAMAMVHLGHATAAASLCRRARVSHPLDADLHHALALCLAAIGEVPAAMEADRQAVWLDADFAQPQMHLALLLRTQGAEEASRQAAGLAVRLLSHESSQRIQLFGNGFSRGALIKSCETLMSPPEGGQR